MSINQKILEIKEMFLIFDDPMDKYVQIIELGKKNPGMQDNEKNERPSSLPSDISSNISSDDINKLMYLYYNIIRSFIFCSTLITVD